MAGIKTKHTEIEIDVRKVLYSLGLRYRTSNNDLPGHPDIANRSRRWVVFVHGCFWHGHPGCRRATLPKRNVEFWKKKIALNAERDARSLQKLRELGYRVIVIWGCETRAPREVLKARLLGLTARPLS